MTFESLDLTGGELLTIMYIQMTWIDEFLVWNPLHYGGITKLPLPYEKLWIPTLSQSNGALNDNTGQIINPNFAPVFVLPNGLVLLVTTGYFVTKCVIDTSLYPFDSHACTFFFFSALYDTTEMELGSHLSGFALGLLQRNDAWRYVSTDFQKVNYSAENIDYHLSSLRFTITLKRRPLFEIINVFFPMFLLTVLNLAANFVPINSGERLSFSVTLYLSFMFITTTMVDEMPHVTVNIAFSSYIMLSLNVLNTMSVLWSVIMIRMATWTNSKTPIPVSIQKLTKIFQNKVSPNTTKVHPIIVDEEIDTVSLGKELENKDTDVQTTENESMQWCDVANVLDKMYFVINSVLVACVMAVMVCLWFLSE